MNIELERGKKIVQKWKPDEEGWPENYYTTLTILFNKTAEGTTIEFMQEGIPEAFADDIAGGWIDYYWTPLKEMFEG
jgi:activator of HSP90 ATPase